VQVAILVKLQKVLGLNLGQVTAYPEFFGEFLNPK
jgi:hypothetical protein